MSKHRFTSPQRQAARLRPPTRVSSTPRLTTKFGGPIVAVTPTSRTTAKGDRTGLRIPKPSVEFSLRKNGSEHTVIPAHHRAPETGRISGARIGSCRACGHLRMVSNVTRLCGVRSCVTARQAAYDRRQAVKEGKRWDKRWDGSVVVS